MAQANQANNRNKAGRVEIRKGVVLGTGKVPTKPPAAVPVAPTAAKPAKSK